MKQLYYKNYNYHSCDSGVYILVVVTVFLLQKQMMKKCVELKFEKG